MPNFTQQTLFDEMKKKGYKVFDADNDYDLTLIGVRTLPGVMNSFDDWITVSYKVSGVWKFHAWPCTTDPGKYWLQNPSRVDGTAVLIPGQYRSCWKLGKHKGQYEALVQNTSLFKVWRDKDKDNQVDYSGKIYSDVLGLNCHKAGTDSVIVDKWSAGCIVFKRSADFYKLMSLVHEQIDAGHGDTFSYALLTL